ncbi:MAG: GspH/FimT family pseudopilin [Thiohalorhabdus sp.]
MHGQRGFTLIELLVALAIIAILAAIAWPSYTAWQQREGLTEGTMYLKSALSAARARSIQSGLTCGCPPGVAEAGDCDASAVSGECTSRLFGVELDTAENRVRLVRLCDDDGEICQGETATGAKADDNTSEEWHQEFSRYVSVNETKTTLDDAIFFNKAGRVSGNAGSVFLEAGGQERCVVVSDSGRIREGVPDGSGSCD